MEDSSKWAQLWREMQDQSWLTPILNLYPRFMNIRRYSSFPFYIYPIAKQGNDSIGAKCIHFLDVLIDAHESEHSHAHYYNMYQRMRYVLKKWPFYQNPSLYDALFFSTFSRAQQDQLTHANRRYNMILGASLSFAHACSFAVLAYALRRRSVSLPAAVAIGALYYSFFKLSYRVAYSVVDGKIGKQLRALGLKHHAAYGPAPPRNIEF